ncbi:D-ribose pyranase [Salisediminibacterium selenitireducens]|uniref:D-ribose pyranase n=1 Tax=Bacillus selenitireducens (strain ATCC 700615 / DSM 15326 / MLS10) TaxID=439292 RepID=D6XZQ8_BACIE|nr:D-ribose pyranase [Salisediminibacterium selenitireducens]ADH98432.1 RbsD or FucU transport [[Bacillus] selenitireducens MLS10]
MKKEGILNRDLAGIFAKLGHTDHIVIADCGLPIPDGVKCVDLSLKKGEPPFLHVLHTVLADLEVEKMVVAREISEHNPGLEEELIALGKEMNYIDHESFKIQVQKAKVVIRTGEVTPYANVILQSGVIF